MGYVSALQIKNEPIMCSLGYSNYTSGLCASMIFIGGVFGSIVFGYLLSCMKNSIQVTKLLCLPLMAIMIILMLVLQQPGMATSIAITYAFFGFLAIG